MTILRVAFLLDALVTAWFVRQLALTIKQEREADAVSTRSLDHQQLLLTIWIAFDLILFAGIFWPKSCAFVLVAQLLYKSIWLLMIAVPNWWKNRAVPLHLVGVFLLYCAVYPWVIPWKTLLRD